MKRHAYNQGEVVFREGEFALSMYEVTSGSVDIYANYDSPHVRLLATLGPGEYFGEMGLAECYPRSATAVVCENGTILDEIDSDELSTYFQDQPAKVLTIMRMLSNRLRETNARYLEARQAICDAMEAEREGKKKSKSLASKLTNMLHISRRSKKD